jgi:hypothetical protein
LTPTDQPADNHRPAVDSIVDVISRYVTDLGLIGPDGLPAWLPGLPVPPGWLIGRAESSPVQPTRTTVHRRDPVAGWDACETINVFRFKGVPPHAIVRFNADRTLRAGGAQDITVQPLQTPADAKMTAVRSSGYLTLANQQCIWAQYSCYIAGDDAQGLLLEHGIFATLDRQAGLRDDIAELSNAVHDAFVNTIAATPERNVHAAGLLGTGDLSPSQGSKVTTFRVGFFPDFKWNDVVLVGADRDGMRVFRSALRSAHEDGEGAFELHGVQHRIVRQSGAADIELGSPSVVWRFDKAKLAEILDMVVELIDVDHPAHNYFDDLNSPAATLMLSIDEYVDGGPFAEFPQGMPVPPSR